MFFSEQVFRPHDGVLDLGGQQLGDQVAKAVASAWPLLGARVERLHLGGNDISDEGPRREDSQPCWFVSSRAYTRIICVYTFYVISQ